MDAICTTHTDGVGILIYLEFPVVEYTGHNLLYSEMNKLTVKKCGFVLIICIIGYGQTAL